MSTLYGAFIGSKVSCCVRACEVHPQNTETEVKSRVEYG